MQNLMVKEDAKWFWFIDRNGNVLKDYFRIADWSHWELVHCDNYFRSEEEAIEASRLLKKLFKLLNEKYDKL